MIVLQEVGNDFLVNSVEYPRNLISCEIEDDRVRIMFDDSKIIARSYVEFTLDGNQYASATLLKQAIDLVAAKPSVYIEKEAIKNSVIPVAGWVLKYNGSDNVLAMKEEAFYQGSPVINLVANTELTINPFVWNFNFQRSGFYKVSFDLSCSIDSTNGDIVIVPEFDGNTIANIANGELARIEGKDSAGNNLDGRGTDQKRPIGKRSYIVEVTDLGSKEIRLSHWGTQNGAEAAIWDVHLEIEEIFNPQLS